jgi:hypothetical protein
MTGCERTEHDGDSYFVCVNTNSPPLSSYWLNNDLNDGIVSLIIRTRLNTHAFKEKHYSSEKHQFFVIEKSKKKLQSRLIVVCTNSCARFTHTTTSAC